jgi:hypothetical protein
LNPLNLTDCDLVFGPFVEFGGPGRRLLGNQMIPFKAQIIVIVTERTLQGLDIKMEALRTAIGKAGCDSFSPQLTPS